MLIFILQLYAASSAFMATAVASMILAHSDKNNALALINEVGAAWLFTFVAWPAAFFMDTSKT
jgi:hypothetical protein